MLGEDPKRRYSIQVITNFATFDTFCITQMKNLIIVNSEGLSLHV